MENEDGITINGNLINNTRYADDSLILASTQQQLQNVDFSAACGLKIDTSKIKMMVFVKKSKRCS